jgi:hypothetical protein
MVVGNLKKTGYRGRVSVEIMHEISDAEKAHSLQLLNPALVLLTIVP